MENGCDEGLEMLMQSNIIGPSNYVPGKRMIKNVIVDSEKGVLKFRGKSLMGRGWSKAWEVVDLRDVIKLEYGYMSHAYVLVRFALA